jgi:uncharacterized membrane protein YeaQ/YmgE (transglycosylase-associated protein family)
MAMLNCLWIGALTGLVASRLIRGRAGLASATSSVAVGVLGALLGGLADSWLAAETRHIPQSGILAASVGAGALLVLWAGAQRVMLGSSAGESTKSSASATSRR